MKIQTIDTLKQVWKSDQTPLFFISPTSFNLMDLDRWIGGMRYVAWIDTFDGQHPKAILGMQTSSPQFEHLEDINLFMLQSKDVDDALNKFPDKRALFLFFNPEIETYCNELNMPIWLPPHELLHRIDSKITTTELGNRVGIHSVPNYLGPVRDFAALQSIAAQHQLGQDWVIQLPYGDSGKTTFFIQSEADFDDVSQSITEAESVKVMKRIRCVSAAIEGCATHNGTYVGPLMTELIGIPELTPYQGGWCGNELASDQLDSSIREQSMAMVQTLGDALYEDGYRGYFEVDVLIDLDSGNAYLGELNARFSGITPMTSLNPYALQTVPLILFHLSEYAGHQLAIDPTEFNLAVLGQGAQSEMAQMVLKYTDSDLSIVSQAPVSGVYTWDAEHGLKLKVASCYRSDAVAPDELYILRIMSEADWAYHGGDLAIVFTNRLVTSEPGKLNPWGAGVLRAVRDAFICRSLTADEQALVARYQNPASRFKS